MLGLGSPSRPRPPPPSSRPPAACWSPRARAPPAAAASAKLADRVPRTAHHRRARRARADARARSRRLRRRPAGRHGPRGAPLHAALRPQRPRLLRAGARRPRRARPSQWWLQRPNFPAAWDITSGAGAIVAVIDTGVDATHPELAGRIVAGGRLRRRPRSRARRRPTRSATARTSPAGLRERRQRHRHRRRGLRLPPADRQDRPERVEHRARRSVGRRQRRRRDQHELRHRRQPPRRADRRAGASTTHPPATSSSSPRPPTSRPGAGRPVQRPAADGHRLGPRPGPRPVVTAADARRSARGLRRARPQISLAAYGAYGAGRPGGPARRLPGQRDRARARLVRPADLRAAAAAPPSTATPATPTCRARRWPRRWSPPSARWCARSTRT